MVYILLAEGFEEAEALIPADLLRRAGLPVSLVGLNAATVAGGHGIAVAADLTLEQVVLSSQDMLLLPGGKGGVESMQMDLFALALIQKAHTVGCYLAAICAAPTLLAHLGLLDPFIDIEEEQLLLPSIPNCEMGRWHPAFVDVTAKGNTKQRGIDEIIRHFGIRLEETMAFGDGGNDISMLRHAGIGVAMGNAKDDVKAAAGYVTTSVDDNGIANALKQYGIIES